MDASFRVINTGVRGGRHQIAFDQSLIELHAAGAVPDTVRFLRFPPTVLIGRHQALSHEVHVDQCRAEGVGLVRRITGGGAIYLDEGQIGWEIVLSRKRLAMPTLGDYARAICEAVAHGLSETFGIDARFRPRNDIEVNGQKISGTGGFFDGDTLFYQGTVLVDVDAARMMRLLNVPEAKLKKRALDSAESRVTTLKALLGRVPSVGEVQTAVLQGLERKLAIRCAVGEITAAEEAKATALYDEWIGTEGFVHEIADPKPGGETGHATRTGAGGTVAAYVRLEGSGGARRVREALLTGDFFVTPPRLILDLEASLRGVPVGEIGAAVDGFFATSKPELLTMPPSELRTVLIDAAAAIA